MRRSVTLASELEIDEIVVAMDDRRQQFPLKELLDCRLAGIEVVELASFLERETGKVYLDILIPSWMIFGSGFRRDVFRRYSERAFDLVASFALLLLALPVMLLTALAIKFEEGLSRAGALRPAARGLCRARVPRAEIPQHARGRRKGWRALGAAPTTTG